MTDQTLMTRKNPPPPSLTHGLWSHLKQQKDYLFIFQDLKHEEKYGKYIKQFNVYPIISRHSTNLSLGSELYYIYIWL